MWYCISARKDQAPVGRDNLNIPEVLDYLRGLLAEPGGEDIADDLRDMVEDVFGRIWRHGGSDDDNSSEQNRTEQNI
jgi:hypothetical protein